MLSLIFISENYTKTIFCLRLTDHWWIFINFHFAFDEYKYKWIYERSYIWYIISHIRTGQFKHMIFRIFTGIPPESRKLLTRIILIYQLCHFNATSVQIHLDLLEYQSAIVTTWRRELAMDLLTVAWQWPITLHYWPPKSLWRRTAPPALLVTQISNSTVSIC